MRLREFAPDSNDDSGGEEDALHKYARMWWVGDEATQLKIEAALNRMGWEIGEDEGGYDNGGVFVVRAGDVNGNSYVSWPAEDLAEAKKKKKKKSSRLQGYFFPGYGYYGSGDSGEGGGDGGGGGESKNRGVAEGSLDEKSTSQAQFRTMAAAAHDPKFARKVGIKPSVAKEFNKADQGQNYKSLPKKS